MYMYQPVGLEAKLAASTIVPYVQAAPGKTWKNRAQSTWVLYTLHCIYGIGVICDTRDMRDTVQQYNPRKDTTVR